MSDLIERIKKGEWKISAELGEGYVETQDLLGQMQRRQAVVDQLLFRAEAATILWDLLDEIDTADDIAKSDDALYRSIVQKLQAKRLEYAKSIDGYGLTWNIPNSN